MNVIPHPDGYRVVASQDDKDLLDKLSQVMAEDGLPEVMLIAGQGQKLAVQLRDRAGSF